LLNFVVGCIVCLTYGVNYSSIAWSLAVALHCKYSTPTDDTYLPLSLCRLLW